MLLKAPLVSWKSERSTSILSFPHHDRDKIIKISILISQAHLILFMVTLMLITNGDLMNLLDSLPHTKRREAETAELANSCAKKKCQHNFVIDGYN